MSKNLTRRGAIRPDRERCCPRERRGAHSELILDFGLNDLQSILIFSLNILR